MQPSHVISRTIYPIHSNQPMAFHNKGKMSPLLTEETRNWAYGNDMLLNNPLTMKTSMALASG